MIYVYRCECGLTFEAEASVSDRYNTVCPECQAGNQSLSLVLQPIGGRMIKHDRLITEAQLVSEQGSDWRETEGSRRKLADEPKRLYSGTHRGPARRKGKAFLSHSPATDSPETQAARQVKAVKEKMGR